MLTPIIVIPLSGRSGTTLLMQLLGTSPEIIFDPIYPFEIRYLTYLMQWALILKDKIQPTEDWNLTGPITSERIESIRAFPSMQAQYWNGDLLWRDSFLSAWKNISEQALKENLDRETKYYAEKAPVWVPSYLRDILLYRSILLVRDPRDIFLSVIAFDKKRGFAGFSRRKWESNWSFAKHFVGLIRERATLIKNEQKFPQSILIKYEDLVTHSLEESSRLEKWLNLKFDPSYVENQRTNYLHHMTSNTPMQSINRWQHEMSKNLINYFKKELSEELEYFGYET